MDSGFILNGVFLVVGVSIIGYIILTAEFGEDEDEEYVSDKEIIKSLED